MFLLLFCSYCFAKYNLENYFQIFLLALIGIAGAWIREEKILAIDTGGGSVDNLYANSYRGN